MEFKKDFYKADGEPVKCEVCFSTSFKEIVKDSIDGHIICEYEVRCSSCKNLCAYWAYGHYDQEFAYEGDFEQ